MLFMSLFQPSVDQIPRPLFQCFTSKARGDTIGIPDLDTLELLAELTGPMVELGDNHRVPLHDLQVDQDRVTASLRGRRSRLSNLPETLPGGIVAGSM